MLLYLLFMLPPLIFMIYAQIRVSSAYNKYSRVRSMGGLTGVQAANRLIAYNGLRVGVEGTQGHLTDHYDPRHKVLRLSGGVGNTASVASLGIVAHEVGHAVQDKLGYAPMRLRAALVPVANLGSRLGFIFVIIGVILVGLNVAFGQPLAWVGVGLFSAAVLFALVTLPVEYNASNRARQMLQKTGMVSTVEYQGASAVLSAAALTYVAALLQAVFQLFYFLMLVAGMGRRD
ncbi:MAG: zinc metallopeptidase [Chloroflexi bacterium]|nr:zinc metallopeptidase [Chloroflexota bacterium]